MGELMTDVEDEMPREERELDDVPVYRPTWGKVDISSVLDGTWKPPLPTVGRCHTAPGLLYAGRRHDVYSESESGKTWLGLRVIIDELEAGNAGVFLDFEDDQGGIVGRLMDMGADPKALRDRFAYIRPDSPMIKNQAEKEAIHEVLGDLKPTIVVLDGRTEAMGMNGCKIIDNDDVAKYGRLVERPLIEFGSALLALDHVVKAQDGRGRYGIGGIHKLNGLNGAAFTLDSISAFGVGQVGRSRLRISKDRPGQLRKHALPAKDQGHWLGDLIVDSSNYDFADVTIQAPSVRTTAFRPTAVMEKISAAMVRAASSYPDGMSQREIFDRVQGKNEILRSAMVVLIDEGYVEISSGARNSKIHKLVKPFEETH